MSIIKIYRYRVQPNKIPQFLNIQKNADRFYLEKVDYSLSHYQSKDDPWRWTEVHKYPTMNMLQTADRLVDDCPPLKKLFHEFLEILDPDDKRISEEIYEDHSIRIERTLNNERSSDAAPICYIEIPAPNIEASASFYTSVFGWKVTQSNLTGEQYWTFTSGPNDLSGAFDPRKSSGEDGVLIYMKVENIPDKLNSAEIAGGSVVQKKTGVGGD